MTAERDADELSGVIVRPGPSSYRLLVLGVVMLLLMSCLAVFVRSPASALAVALFGVCAAGLATFENVRYLLSMAQIDETGRLVIRNRGGRDLILQKSEIAAIEWRSSCVRNWIVIALRWGRGSQCAMVLLRDGHLVSVEATRVYEPLWTSVVTSQSEADGLEGLHALESWFATPASGV